MSSSWAYPCIAPWRVGQSDHAEIAHHRPRINIMLEDLLREAVDLLNKLWLVYREEIYADQTDQIVWKSVKRLILRSGCLDKTKRKRPSTSSPLLDFPEHLCKRPNDRVILLNFLQCNVAVKHMQCILDWLLEGRFSTARSIIACMSAKRCRRYFRKDRGSSLPP